MTDEWRQTRLDHAITAIILGFFASAWFGWAHAGVTSGAVLLNVGSAPAVLIAIIGFIAAPQLPRKRAAAQDPGQRRRYGVIVGIEFGLIVLGVLVLSVSH